MTFHDLFLNFSWLLHVHVMNCSFCFQNSSMTCSWFAHDTFMTCPRLFQEFFMSCSWLVYDFFIHFAWLIHDMLVPCTIFFHGFSWLFTIFKWLGHTFLRIFFNLLMNFSCFFMTNQDWQVAATRTLILWTEEWNK